MHQRTTILFLGTATVTPGPGQDTACLLINRTCLVDTGWNAAINMLQYNCNPMDVDSVLITHCHHDHYIGLPQLLFYHAMRRGSRPDKGPLTVIGPKPDIGMVVERALHFLRHEQFPDAATVPRVVALQAGQSCEAGALRITTSPTVHPVVGLCYRLEDTRTGGVVVVTGDTAYHPPLAAHAAGADLLVHEASRGPVASDPNAISGHSGSIDAARIALEATVRQLALVHYPGHLRNEVLRAAQDVFPQTVAPLEGECIELA
ncbi:MAG: MBL fold metallo-hydrolase [Lentisphaeria bacterium]|nr:MBL fold metallo-hydrolase [Lentisphaeria bacterium]